MPCSYVDIVAVILPVGQNAAAGPISKIVLQNIKVLASGAKIDSPQDQRQPTDAKAVTVQVTPKQAEKLVLAANEGKLQLVMRNYGDQEDAETTGANKQSLLGGEPVVPDPGPTTEKKVEPKAPVARPRVRRPSPAVSNPDRPVAVATPSRNSVELIEGSKRREVDIP
jgi:pilus assembly protein CpaB